MRRVLGSLMIAGLLATSLAGCGSTAEDAQAVSDCTQDSIDGPAL